MTSASPPSSARSVAASIGYSTPVVKSLGIGYLTAKPTTSRSKSSPRIPQPPPNHITFREFVAQAWKVVEPGTVFVPGEHIDLICTHLEAAARGLLRQLIINIPPRHMKSTLVSVLWPAWVWTYWPESRWLSASYAHQLAVRDTVKARRVIQSPWYQGHWGNVFQMTKDQNVKSRYENNRGGHRIATSVGSAVTGEGGEFILVDDPNQANQVTSEVAREGVRDWWDHTMSTRQNDVNVGAKVVVMQRLHESDLTGHLLEKGNWVHLMLPAEFEPDRKCVTPFGADWRKTEGELLWPAKKDQREINDLKRDLGAYGSSGQLQQRPSPAEGGIFKRHWWQFYERMPDSVDEIVHSWDMAFKATNDSAYVVGQTWARLGADYYLVWQTREKLTFTESCTAVKQLAGMNPGYTAILIEDKANGPAIIDALRRAVPGILPIEPDGSKEARAHATSPTVEAGNVYLPSPRLAPWIDVFVDECANFPNGAYADQVDCATQAIRWLRDRSTALLVEWAAPRPISPV